MFEERSRHDRLADVSKHFCIKEEDFGCKEQYKRYASKKDVATGCRVQGTYPRMHT
jgi:hypothetical protein